jgi:tetratricopeptide (TPR) repeat protein
MGKSRAPFSLYVSVAFGCVILLSSCAMPKIIILKDTLTAEQHNDLGYIYETKGLYDLAEKEYLLAVKKKKDWHIPYFNLGNLAFRMGSYAKSEIFFRDALNYDPHNADVMNNLANAVLMQDRPQEARLLIERAIQITHKKEYLDTLQKIRAKEERLPN